MSEVSAKRVICPQVNVNNTETTAKIEINRCNLRIEMPLKLRSIKLYSNATPTGRQDGFYPKFRLLAALHSPVPSRLPAV